MSKKPFFTKRFKLSAYVRIVKDRPGNRVFPQTDITEIEKLNHAKKEMEGFIASCSRYHKTKPDYDYIDLGALARNIFYMILREKITQN